MDNLWLDDLPKEILEHIVSYMGSDEQLNMRLANTKWFKLINYRNFTLRFTSEETLPEIIERLLQYNGPIGLKFVKSKFKKLDVYAQVSRLTNLTSLKLPYFYESYTPPEAWWGFSTLTNLREWEVPYGCPVSVTASLINKRNLSMNSNLGILLETAKKMSNLEELDCSPKINEPLDVFSLLPCPSRLTSLETNGKLDYTHASKLYNLRELIYDGKDTHIPLQLSLEKFTALDNLRIEQDHLLFGALPTTLTSLAISGESMDTNCNQYLASLHKLNELHIETLYLNDERYSWISHLTSLTQLSMWPTVEENIEPFTGAMFNTIKSSKLRILEIKATPHLDLGHLSCLTTLENLYIDEDNAEVHPDYSFASHLTRLTKFAIYTVTGWPSLTSLANLNNLKNLSAYNPLPAMSLGQLTSLESLSFDKWVHEDHLFESLSALTRLTCLKANSLPDINYEFLTTMPLRELRISHNVGERFYTVLVQLTGLQALKIQGLSAEQVIGLSALQHLTWLDVAECDVGEGLHVTHLTTLQVLYVKKPASYSLQIRTSLPNLVDLIIR